MKLLHRAGIGRQTGRIEAPSLPSATLYCAIALDLRVVMHYITNHARHGAEQQAKGQVMSKIYGLYGNLVAEVTSDAAGEIKEFCRAMRRDIGMGNARPLPDGVTVRYCHTYGHGSAQVYYRGSQIASA